MNRYSLRINPHPNFKLEDHSILNIFTNTYSNTKGSGLQPHWWSSHCYCDNSAVCCCCCYYHCKIYSYLSVTRWQSAGKSTSQQHIKAIYPSTLRMMCAVLTVIIIVIINILILIIKTGCQICNY